MLTDMLFGLFGLTVLVGIAVLFSNNRGAISWRLVGIGIGLQLLFAVIVILTTWGSDFFSFISGIFVKVIAFTNEGSM